MAGLLMSHDVFGEFLLHPMQTEAVVLFSKEIVDKMFAKSNVGTAKTIVEFGCGEGVVTE
jgi:phospholipid N-methyltransferase